MNELLEWLNYIEDYRQAKKVRHKLKDIIVIVLFATLANNCAKAGIIDTEEPPDLLSRIATDLVCHELYVWCSQKGNFSLRARARQYAEVAYHVKPEYRMPAEQRDAL